MPLETASDTAATAAGKPPAAGTRTEARERAARNRKLTVYAARVGVLAAFLGLWEVGARTEVVDPFNFSQPSRIWDQI